MDLFMATVLAFALVLSVVTLGLYQSKCKALEAEIGYLYRTQAELELLSSQRLDTIASLERRIDAYDRILHSTRNADGSVSTTFTTGGKQ